jgi:hypothetical protein
MTIRQRIVAALRGETPDQIPFTTYLGMIPSGELERRLRAKGLGFSVRVGLLDIQRPNVTVTHYEYTKGEVRYRRTTMSTPVGEIHAITRPGSAYGSNWWYEHYIKGPDDYRVMEYIVRDTQYVANYDWYHEAVANVGEDGYVSGNMGYSPLLEMRVNLLGIERFSLDMYDRPDLFFSLYQTMRKKERQAYPILANSPAELVIYCGNCSPETLGRQRFEEFCVPCYNELGAMLHEKGKLLGCHLDANNRIWKEAVAASAIDVVEAFTPAPDTDMSVADARAAWPGKVLWINFPSSLHLASSKRIREATRQMMAEAAPGDRFIVGITENIPGEVWRTSMRAIAETLAKRPS